MHRSTLPPLLAPLAPLALIASFGLGLACRGGEGAPSDTDESDNIGDGGEVGDDPDRGGDQGSDQGESPDPFDLPSGEALYDPIATARASIGQIDNREAPVLPQCYTRTEGTHNPCWVCHVPARYPNVMADWDLQGSYQFSAVGKTNHWTNLFADHSAEIAAISDEEILAWIRSDNYAALRAAIAAIPADDYPGYRPDLDFAAGFDDEGFAVDHSGWRAFTYKPFSGVFWPTNGSTDDVMIRLPAHFRETRALYKINLAILEASMATDLSIPDAEISWTVEPIDETVAGFDLDGDGELEAAVTQILGLPAHYAGGAAEHPVRRGLYPEDTEFLHSVRYVDPDQGISARMKELRYSKKVDELAKWAILAAYEQEAEDKDEGLLPLYAGSPMVGLRNAFGWQLQGFIEDDQGRLRLQTHEEHYFCMGCHSTIGGTADQSFSFPRKQPGAAGWRYQDISGMPDVPQAGHSRGEVATYLERVGAGDEFRANQEMIERFFDEQGALDEAAVAAASADLSDMLMPSPARALALGKAYLVIVREQSFVHGRDAVIAPVANVFESIEDESSGLSESGKMYADGTLRLDWSQLP
ncbi:hypothetical protein G6O69_37380 [Pseudenhygromyxa sp. WMMC2535]|uniref:hypothetical protein n=1 Tax=Pseudenhygromyxa sp. WMMC2535 TaxID=2712867 RepID=UPI001555338C|nr:hypothetical protein [Pseudenhygromyxa sp. WMMC2535]NVB40354.1 hypothetical protein [Pseudenhygromyxa sp. WMMC2535]NVB43548.1 hypothetical protein [Pseudenhygromyxa sp. WMMC2535]